METITHDLTEPETIPDERWDQGFRVGITCSCGWDKGNNVDEAEARMWGKLHLDAAHRGMTQPMAEYDLAEDPTGADLTELKWVADQGLELAEKAQELGYHRAGRLVMRWTWGVVHDEIVRQREALQRTVDEIEWDGHRAWISYSDEGYLYLCSCDDWEFRQETELDTPDPVIAIRRYAGHLEHHGIDPWSRELSVKYHQPGEYPPDDLDAAEARARELPPIPPRYRDDEEVQHEQGRAQDDR